MTKHHGFRALGVYLSSDERGAKEQFESIDSIEERYKWEVMGWKSDILRVKERRMSSKFFATYSITTEYHEGLM